MNIIDKTIGILDGYTPYSNLGQDYVQRGVNYLLKGNKEKAKDEFIYSGLGLKGLLYFACRIYTGEHESDVYEFIINNFSE